MYLYVAGAGRVRTDFVARTKRHEYGRGGNWDTRRAASELFCSAKLWLFFAFKRVDQASVGVYLVSTLVFNDVRAALSPSVSNRGEEDFGRLGQVVKTCGGWGSAVPCSSRCDLEFVTGVYGEAAGCWRRWAGVRAVVRVTVPACPERAAVRRFAERWRRLSQEGIEREWRCVTCWRSAQGRLLGEIRTVVARGRSLVGRVQSVVRLLCSIWVPQRALLGPCAPRVALVACSLLARLPVRPTRVLPAKGDTLCDVGGEHFAVTPVTPLSRTKL